MKKARKLLCTVIALVIVLSSFSCAFAAGNTVALDELEMTITIPDSYSVYTREGGDSAVLSDYGLSLSDLISYMKDSNIYLNALSGDGTNEIVVTGTDGALDSFNDLSDASLSALMPSIVSQYADYGIEVSDHAVYSSAHQRFARIMFSQQTDDGTVYGLQFYTVSSGKAVNVTLRSYSGEITAAQETTMKTIVDSVVFDGAPSLSDSAAETSEEFTYTDSETNASFTVPANWIEVPLSKERDFVDAKFESLEDEGLTIVYGSTDLWSMLSAEEQRGSTRADINNSALTKADVAEMIGIDSGAIDMVTYGGHEFFRGETTYDTEAAGLQFSVAMTCFYMVDNGYLYQFQFGGTKDDSHFSDMEKLLTSLKLEKSSSAAGTTKTESGSWKYSWANLLISLLITIAIYSLPIIIYRYAIRKSPVDRKRAKTITILYGIGAFLAMSGFLYATSGNIAHSSPIVLWSWVNYKMLTGGGSVKPEPVPAPVAPLYPEKEAPPETVAVSDPEPSASATEPEAPQIRFCRKCGKKLEADSQFCRYCGEKR